MGQSGSIRDIGDLAPRVRTARSLSVAGVGSDRSAKPLSFVTGCLTRLRVLPIPIGEEYGSTANAVADDDFVLRVLSVSSMTERTDQVPTTAQKGDEAAFDVLVGPYRRELRAHCYRMMGSVHDAEDVMQEVLLRTWQALPNFGYRSSLRVWLYRITTNACLNEIKVSSRRFLPVEMSSEAAATSDETRWVGPYVDTNGMGPAEHSSPAGRYEQRESLELAFVAALQYLPPNQRAALILRDVLGFSARDAADTLDTTVSAINSSLQHARKTVKARVPERSQQLNSKQLGDIGLRRIVERYIRALEDADIDAVVSMLAEDATWSMPPHPEWFQGHDRISGFLTTGPFRVRWRHLPLEVNGQPAVACYAWDEAAGAYRADVIDVLTLDGAHIRAVTAFVDPSLFTVFDLPDRLPERPHLSVGP